MSARVGLRNLRAAGTGYVTLWAGYVTLDVSSASRILLGMKKREVEERQATPAQKKKPSMQERGFKAMTFFLKVASYHALKRRTTDAKVPLARHVAQLVEADLRKTGYLPELSK